jgi:nicotinate-nucleotide adenylyltransferase
MCRLATDKLPWAEISDFDIKAPTPSYSWRTAEHFKKLYPDARLFWLMGTDQWQSIAQWDRSAYFISLVDIIVYSRGSKTVANSGSPSIPLNTLRHPASATAIRSRRMQHTDPAWLDPQVHNYIQQKSLYQMA